MTLRIQVDSGQCMGSGNCEFWAPATFEIGDDNIAHVADPDGEPEERVRSAAENCPTGAITIIERDGPS